MQIQSITNVAHLLNKFIQFNHRCQSIQTQILLLTLIKKALIDNPNNFYHQVHGRLSFQTIYEFIIDCISRQQHPQVLGFLLHVLALITKYWVTNSENLKTLYEGILAVFQQRSFCKENCFRYFTILVQTMQDNNQLSLNLTINDKLSHFSSTSVIRSNLQNYFVYHLLNELLAFANIFLDRSVVRNDNTNQNSERQIKNSRISEQNSRSRQSQSFQRGSLKHYSVQNSQDQSSVQELSQQCELYKIEQNQSVILSILSLIRACLSYDFSHTSRHEQQSQYQPHKSPIILPTKYSKYCKFSEYDIFLKSENTTQMLNYLFLICNTIQLKLQILRILQAMARIHFRYFKNKTYHKIHLEDIGYVVGNLLTGLDLQQSMSVSIKGSVRTTFIDTRTKVNIAVSLGQIVSILLYHQPTFYLVDNTLMEMIIQHLQTFIIDQILDPEHFNPFVSGYKSVNSLSVSDLCLLIETFMSPFVKLKDFIKHYLNASQVFSEKINELFIRVGQKFFMILNKMDYQNNEKQTKTFNKNQYKSNQKKNNKSLQLDKYSPIPQQQSNKWISNHENLSIYRQEEESKFQFKSQKVQNEKELTQTHFYSIQGIKNSCPKKQNEKQNVCFLKSLFQEYGNIEVIRNILSVFKVYCPKHIQLSQILNKLEKRASQKINITNSDVSYKSNISETQTAQNLNDSRLDSNIERIVEKSNDRGEQKCEIQYQKWMISWICNFENHFHVTGGHCRHSRDWQIELHEQLMKQLIYDLNWGMESYIKEQNNNRKQVFQEKQSIQIGECIKIILLYAADKIVNECRISCQEYISKIDLNLLLILQWISSYCCFMGTKKNESNQDKVHELIPILDLINNIKIQDYLQAVQILKYNKQNTQEQKTQKVYKTCQSSLKYFLNVLAMLDLNKEQNIINEGLNDKLLYILLKFYMGSCNLVGKSQTNSEASYQSAKEREDGREIMQIMRQTLIKQSGFGLVAKVLAQTCEQINLFSQTFFHNSSTKISYMMYDLIRDQCFMLYNVKECAFSQIKESSFVDMVKCLQLLLKTERKTQTHLKADKQNVQNILRLGKTYLQNINSYLSHKPANNCQCTQIIQYGLAISIELSFVNNAENALLELTKELLNLLQEHNACLKQGQLTEVQRKFNHIVNILPSLVSKDCLYQQLRMRREEQNFGLLSITKAIIWLLSYLGCLFEINAYNDATLVNIQNTIIEYVIGRCQNKCATGLIGSLQRQLNREEYGQIQQQVFNRLKLENIQKIIQSLCKYLQKRTKQKIYLSQIAYELPKSNNNIKQYECIRVDNMILIFCLYHHVWEYLHQEFSHIIQSTVSNSVVFQSIQHMDKLGVAWVIRKLQQWNMSSNEKLQFQQRQKSIAQKPEECNQNDQKNQKQNLQAHEEGKEIMQAKIINQFTNQEEIYREYPINHQSRANSERKIINVEEDIGTRTQINQTQKQVNGLFNKQSSHKKQTDQQNPPDIDHSQS